MKRIKQFENNHFIYVTCTLTWNNNIIVYPKMDCKYLSMRRNELLEI